MIGGNTECNVHQTSRLPPRFFAHQSDEKHPYGDGEFVRLDHRDSPSEWARCLRPSIAQKPDHPLRRQQFFPTLVSAVVVMADQVANYSIDPCCPLSSNCLMPMALPNLRNLAMISLSVARFPRPIKITNADGQLYHRSSIIAVTGARTSTHVFLMVSITCIFLQVLLPTPFVI